MPFWFDFVYLVFRNALMFECGMKLVAGSFQNVLITPVMTFFNLPLVGRGQCTVVIMSPVKLKCCVLNHPTGME